MYKTQQRNINMRQAPAETPPQAHSSVVDTEIRRQLMTEKDDRLFWKNISDHILASNKQMKKVRESDEDWLSRNVSSEWNGKVHEKFTNLDKKFSKKWTYHKCCNIGINEIKNTMESTLNRWDQEDHERWMTNSETIRNMEGKIFQELWDTFRNPNLKNPWGRRSWDKFWKHKQFTQLRYCSKIFKLRKEPQKRTKKNHS